jgi:hypothetical protein
MNRFPEAVTDIIAIGADEDFTEIREIVRRLPVGVQLDALSKIIGLTFTGDAEVKKLVEIVTRMAEQVQLNMEKLTGKSAASDNGNGSFAGQ